MYINYFIIGIINTFCIYSTVVNVSAQGSCTVTPTSPITLTAAGGVLVDGTQNVMIECRCVDGSNVALSPVRWFHPNNMRISSQSNTPTGAPYYISSDSSRLATLVIPTFNDSYDGTYTCGWDDTHPPFPRTTTTLTLPGEMSEQSCQLC